MRSGPDSSPSSIGLPPPPTARRSSDEDSHENESASSPQPAERRPTKSQRSPNPQPENASGRDASTSSGAPNTWALHQNFLKHLTTIALVMAGGIITLLQSDLMQVKPPFVLSFLPPLLSFMLTLGAHWDLVKKADQDLSSVPRSVYWAEMVAIALFGAAIGVTSTFFLLEIGILPEL